MKENLFKPQITEGGFAVDDRGQLSFVNNFNFEGVKRFYLIENFSTETVRAWHGHMKETKHILVVSGSAIVAAVAMSETTEPDKTAEIHRFVLSARKPSILSIPAGYANGIKSLVEGTRIVIFSNGSLEESKGDDYRFPYDYWGTHVWKTEHR